MTGKLPAPKVSKVSTPRKKVNSPSPKKSLPSKDVVSSSSAVTEPSINENEMSWDGNTSDSNGHVTLNLEFPNWDERCSDTDSSVNLEIVEDINTALSYKKSRKRLRSEVSAEDNVILDGMEEEIERQLESKAEKNNLSVLNVKYILRQVITHPHVLAMVKRSAKDGNCTVSGDNEHLEYEPKLTRAKAKELLERVKDVDWPVTPCKKPVVSEFEALAIQEMAEDSDDEEYQPGDETSDNDYSERDNSELDTPIDQSPAQFEADDLSNPAVGTPDSTVDKSIVLWSEDGIFKVPMAPSELQKDNTPVQEEGVIAKRTRSKLSLSDTPLEEIEKAFVAPDVPPGYYESQPNDTNGDNEDWHEFLKEFMEPLPSGPHGTQLNDDDEADPEYNVLAEEEVVDKEELRMDRAVKVSRKEAKSLLAELFDFTDALSSEDDDNVTDNSTITRTLPSVVQNQADSTTPGTVNDGTSNRSTVSHPTHCNATPIRMPYLTENQVEECGDTVESGKSNEQINHVGNSVAVRDGEPQLSDVHQTTEGVESEVCCAYQFSLPQRLLLDQQIRQHVQLLTQNFLLTYEHPTYSDSDYSGEMMKLLDDIRERADNNHPQSPFRAANLQAAFQIIEDWKQIMRSEKSESIKRFVVDELDQWSKALARRSLYGGKLPPELMELMSNSVAFVTPQLLPQVPFKCKMRKRTIYVPSELMLITLGMKEFLDFVKANSTGPKRFYYQQTFQYLAEYLIPTKTPEQLYTCYRKEKNREGTPFNYLAHKDRAPSTVHFVFPFNADAMLTPRQQPSFLLPPEWRDFLYPASMKD